jgi:hypothetical protein
MAMQAQALQRRSMFLIGGALVSGALIIGHAFLLQSWAKSSSPQRMGALNYVNKLR